MDGAPFPEDVPVPTKRTFDLIVITSGVLLPLAIGLVKIAGRRWSAQGSGPLSVVGDATQVVL